MLKQQDFDPLGLNTAKSTMTVLTGATLSDVGIDGVAIKPTEIDLEQASKLDVGTITIDYEGQEHLPETDLLSDLADSYTVRLTAPVRADGFDPLGDDSELTDLPDVLDHVLVAGHHAYLSDEERRRTVAPRLEAAAEDVTDPWIGTEGIERIALAIGGTQFELLSETTLRDVRALRQAGFDGSVAVYAPTVLTDEPNIILDAVGEYAARRQRVREALPEGAPRDSTATGRAQNILEQACREYALVGDPDTVAERVNDLHAAGVDHVISYPARGLDPFLDSS